MKNITIADAYSFLMTEIFPGIIQCNPTLIKELESFDNDIELKDKAFLFTIPALFQLLCHLYEQKSGNQIDADRKNYLQFRKLLYSNPTNSQLRDWGGHVVVESTNPKHDQSIYKLYTDK
ncbi:MAG: hypothetical protein ACI8W1_001599 [Candidatus Azotimanducaceae bacterium]|jgi:hypothetical protein|tara:strand:- start:3807 stop:4166 length:360 start_codon:yes stop_codon:yes gene_type:complete